MPVEPPGIAATGCSLNRAYSLVGIGCLAPGICKQALCWREHIPVALLLLSEGHAGALRAHPICLEND
jgi:hypothetical protein